MKNYTVAVDLGEGMVRVGAAYKETNGALHIAAYAAERTNGVKMGRIENIVDVSEALQRAVATVEAKIGAKINSMYCGIAGDFVYMAQHEETIDVIDAKGCVTDSDYVKLAELMRKVKAPENYRILSRTMQSTNINGKLAYKKMVGNFSRKIAGCYNFSLCETDAVERVNSLFERNEVKVRKLIPSSIVMGQSVLSQEAKEGGVAVVDLGKGVTNVAIYYQGKLCYSISIPIGADALNNDLRSLNISEHSIEDIKCTYGCAIADKAEMKVISIMGEGNRSTSRIPLYNIAVVIEERMKSIVKFVEREIRDAGFESRLPYGIVLCGGGAKLRSVAELFQLHLSINVSVADCRQVLTGRTAKSYEGAEFATLIALLMRGADLDARGKDEPCIALQQQGGAVVIEQYEPEEPIAIREPITTIKEPKRAKKVANQHIEEQRNLFENEEDIVPKEEPKPKSGIFSGFKNPISAIGTNIQAMMGNLFENANDDSDLDDDEVYEEESNEEENN